MKEVYDSVKLKYLKSLIFIITEKKYFYEIDQSLSHVRLFATP